ncbi:protein BZR1 homolog 3-like [Zingiber officinale]|uniref:protein BZR1 homolog 3-like n=1 Tax=Zingiber officinale TaxID=94328 RepID=UPI001C4C1E6E|nr:protein BZR1 homolog 3-like [Zingiber officinale]
MTSGARMATWRERENNMRRERRRRAIAAKIYAGLRAYGNYSLPKHCDNNAVLKALCEEAGWTVEEDGTTYRKGSRPVKSVEIVGPSASPSPCSSYQPSPSASYNPSPASSTLASPASSTLITNGKNISDVRGNSLAPWLTNLPHLYLHGGSISAPVSPPLSSPSVQSPRIEKDWNELNSLPPWAGFNHNYLPSSMPPSPGAWATPDSSRLDGLRLPSGGPSSPTFTLVSPNPFGFCNEVSGSRMWTPGQSGTCSPVQGGNNHGDVQTSNGASDDFAFGCSNDTAPTAIAMVKAWEGERIHEVCASDELELTLGCSKIKSIA